MLSQQVPIRELSHLEPDHPIHVIEVFMVDMASRITKKEDMNGMAQKTVKVNGLYIS